MQFLNRKWILVTIILIIAFILRVYNISSNPPGLTPDEAAIGYNAYSILKTGKDEYGVRFPIIFKSFGDFKPGLYIYLTVPSVAIFGLNEFSTRLPSIIAGTLSVYLIYLIVGELFKNKQLALISLIIAAINPWLIFFSRGAWEVNIALTLTLAGIYFFLLALKNQKFIILSAFFFALTLVAYQGAKLSTGIVLVILAIIYWKQCFKFNKKYLLVATFLSLIVVSPIILSLFNGQAGRLTVFSVFSYPRPTDYVQSFLSEGNIKKGSPVYDLFYNEPLNFVRGILGRLFNHYSARFLFFVGDWANPRHTSPYQGVLVIGDAIFLIIGLVVFLKKKIPTSTTFVWLWLLLAPLPAILSRDQVQAVRSFNLVVPLIILVSIGIHQVIKSRKIAIWILVFGIYTATYAYFLDSYFIQQPKINSQYWQYGYKQMVEIVTPLQHQYKTVRIQQSYDQPYIYFLFYQKYDPAKWQKQAYLKQDAGLDVGHVERLDNICFCALDWTIDRGDHGDLIIADTKVVPPLDSTDPNEFVQIAEIKYLNNKFTAWRILAVK